MSPSNSSADIQIVDAEGNSLVQINHVVGAWEHDEQTAKGDSLDTKSISQLNHWFSSLPAAATATAGNSPQLMRCSFEFNQLVQAKDGSGALGVVLKPDSHKIGAQARFHEAENLKSMFTANLIFNFASQALAQKHLADIVKHLREIDKKIDEIQTHLERERYAPIEVLGEELQRIVRVLMAGGKVDPISLQTLSLSAQEVRKSVRHIRKGVADAHAGVKSFDPSSRFGSNDLRDALKGKIEVIDCLQRQYLVGMQCLLMANLTLFTQLEGSKVFAIAIQDYLNEIEGVVKGWEDVKRKVSSHLNQMKPTFELAKSSHANALQVDSKLQQADCLLYAHMEQAAQLNKQFQAAQSPLLEIEVLNGKVLRGRHLTPTQS